MSDHIGWARVSSVQSGNISKAELARQFNVSRMTIMRTVENTEASKA